MLLPNNPACAPDLSASGGGCDDTFPILATLEMSLSEALTAPLGVKAYQYRIGVCLAISPLKESYTTTTWFVDVALQRVLLLLSHKSTCGLRVKEVDFVCPWWYQVAACFAPHLFLFGAI